MTSKEIDSTQFNQVVDANDAYFSFLINPREAYTSPYSSSFEWVVGGSAFSFEHADWGWKFVNLDATGGSHYVNGFSNFANYDGEYMVYSALTPPNSLALVLLVTTLKHQNFHLPLATMLLACGVEVVSDTSQYLM